MFPMPQARCRHIAPALLLAFWLLPAGPARAAEPLPAATLPSLTAAIRVDEPLAFCGERVPLEVDQVRERMEKELLLTLWDRPQVILWLKRCRRYMPRIEALLQAAELPSDLKYVTLAESALRPHVGSPKGAIGFWQFMPATARAYGLTVDERLDERRNLETSTRAAIAYFQALHADLGSWTLAAAAFNMGEQGLLAEILTQQERDYYHLYLPLETQRYLFRILAAKLIVEAPGRYGFDLGAEERYAPVPSDSVTVVCTDRTPLLVAARAAGTRFKTLKDLNPQIRGHHLAAGSYTLAVPPGAAAGFDRRFAQLVDEWAAARDTRVYTVVAGDNLSSIAARFNVPLPALLLWNRLAPGKPIHPGQRLLVAPPGLPADKP